MRDRWVSPKSGLGPGQKNRNSLVKNIPKGLTLFPGCVREEHAFEEELSNVPLVGLVTCKKKVYLG